MSVLRLQKNTTGKDYVVGDIHGMASLLGFALGAIGFDPEKDRLFSVGDLVDRGAESLEVLEYLEKPWFYAVQGNHEQMAIHYAFSDDWMDSTIYMSNGGGWFIGLPKCEQADIAHELSSLPLVIEVEDEAGAWGIVHAEPAGQSWQSMCDTLENGDAFSREMLINQITWGRDRIKNGSPTDFPGIRRIYVGHTPVQAPIALGNVIYIDTGAVFGRAMTIVDVGAEKAFRFENQPSTVR